MATGTYKQTNNTVATYGENSAANLALQNAINAVSPNKISVDSKYGDQTKGAYDSLVGQGYTYANGAFTKAPVVTPNPTPSPTDTSVVAPVTPRPIYNNVPEITTAKTVDEIQAEKLRQSQAEIDSLNKYYDTLATESRVLGEKNTRSTNAISTLTGLAGSSEADVAQNKTDMGNKADLAKVENERNVAVQSVLSKIRTSAVEEAKQSRSEARQSEQDRISYLTNAQTDAISHLATLSKVKSGVTLAGLKATLSPEEYDYLIKNAGGEEMAKAIIFENRPQDTLIGSPVNVGGHIVQYYKAPDGSTKSEAVPLPAGVTADNIKSITKGGDGSTIIIKNDGSWSKIAGSGKITTEPGGWRDGENPQLYSGLTSKTATAVRSKVTKFSTEPTVQNFATVQDGYNFASSISDNTKNPADDQALIYSLAKALDPGSVVREGEYATAQKYAQSWVNAYGKKVTQAIAGTGFLSEEARRNIKKTIEQKYNSTQKSYNNISKQYEAGINSLTGRKDGSKFLIDYSTAYEGQGGGQSQIEYQGKIYNVDENGEMTPVE